MRLTGRGKSLLWIGALVVLIACGIAVYFASASRQNSNRPRPAGNARAELAMAATHPLANTGFNLIGTNPTTQPNEVHFAVPVGGVREISATKTGPDHYVIRSTQQHATGGFYPLLKLTNVKGKTVTLDLCGAPWDKRGHTTLRYGYVTDLSYLKYFDCLPQDPQPTTTASIQQPANPNPETRNPNPDFSARPRTGDWAALPDTSHESWHFFKHETRIPGTLSLTQTFTEDTVYVTNRIPYTPKYNENYLATLRNNPYVEVVEIGKSKEGRPLQLVKTRGTSADEQTKPCVLIYAREHCDEQDGSWVAQGAIDFLASNDPQAQKVRSECTFLIIPLLDPDGVAMGVHENMIKSFRSGGETNESLALARWFEGWVDEGKRLDVSISVHDPSPVAAFHVACPMMEPGLSRTSAAENLHIQIRAALIGAGYTVRLTPWQHGKAPSRLLGWLSQSYDTLPLPYEINSLTPRRELNLAEVRRIGQMITLGACGYLSSSDCKPLLAELDQHRQRRKVKWASLIGNVPPHNPIFAEIMVARKILDASGSVPAEVSNAPSASAENSTESHPSGALPPPIP